MVTAKDVYPPRDLPGRADAWGRRVEDVDKSLFDTQVQLDQKVDNGLRATSGQLAVLAKQLDELGARSSHSTPVNEMEIISGGNSGEYGPLSRGFSFPDPVGADRVAILFGSGSIIWTGDPTGGFDIADSVTVGIEVLQSGRLIWNDQEVASSNKMFSFSRDGTFSVVVPVTVPITGSSFTVRMYVGRTSSGGQANAGARLQGMQFTLWYGDRV